MEQYSERRFKDFRAFSEKEPEGGFGRLLVLSGLLVLLLLADLFLLADQLLVRMHVPGESLTGIWTCSFALPEGEKLPAELDSAKLRLEIKMLDEHSGKAWLRDGDVLVLNLKLRYKWGKMSLSGSGRGGRLALEAKTRLERSVLELNGRFTADFPDSETEKDVSGRWTARQGGLAD